MWGNVYLASRTSLFFYACVWERICNHFLEKSSKRATVFVSTTGDTGGTTIRSVTGMKNMRAIVAYPRHTVSRIQELQMTTTGAENALVYSHDGISDEVDLILRNIFTDHSLRGEHVLLSFNSIHTVRVILNITHYVYVYLRLVPRADRSIAVSIPTGGMGNTAGAFMAAGMGLPIQILCAVNENDVVHRAFTHGDFSITKPQVPTYATSLDSLLPHNIERVFFFALDGDTAALKELMEDFERKQKGVVPQKILKNSRHLFTASVDKTQCLETIRGVWRDYGYALCPHTAVAWKPAFDYATKATQKGLVNGSNEGATPLRGGRGSEKCDTVVVMATATAAKFPDTMEKAGVPAQTAPWMRDLEGREEKKLLLNRGENWEQILRNALTSLSGFI